VSVVIPAFNEEEGLPATLRDVAAYFDARDLVYEILVSDDGSEDATPACVEAAREAGLPVRSLREPVNRGKGSAVRRGMLAAAGEFVLFTDADLSTPMAEFDRFLPLLEGGAPIVIGSRKTEPRRVVVPQHPIRQFLGRGFSWLARRLLNPEVSDFTCGFKAFSRAAVPLIFGPSRIDGWAFDAEILHIAHRKQIRVVELPVTWTNRAESRVRFPRDILTSAAGLLQVVWNGVHGRYSGPPT
jgi:glycosyltransferase involved in cell wall biosynthesis